VMKQLDHFVKADPDYGRMVADELEIKLP
jgi:catalase